MPELVQPAGKLRSLVQLHGVARVELCHQEERLACFDRVGKAADSTWLLRVGIGRRKRGLGFLGVGLVGALFVCLEEGRLNAQVLLPPVAVAGQPPPDILARYARGGSVSVLAWGTTPGKDKAFAICTPR